MEPSRPSPGRSAVRLSARLSATAGLLLSGFVGLTGAHAFPADGEVALPTQTVRPPVSAPAAPRAARTTAPLSPPARMCGSPALDGPARPPAGAVRVTTAQDLPEAVDNRRGGTTFWLAPGVHRFGPGVYDQVRPKNDDVFIGAPGAVIDGGHRNAYAFVGYATGVRISHLTIQNFGSPGDNNNEGVVNHDAGHRWRITHSTIQNNAGAGVFLGSGARVVSSCLRDNGQYGFSAYEAKGVSNIRLRHNEITGNNTDDWEARWEGCGCTGGGKFWDTRNADIVDNWVHDNRGPGLWADTNNTGFRFEGNLIEENDSQGIFYEISYNAAIKHNTFRRNGLVEGPVNRGFPTGAIYLSESGSDVRAGTTYGRRFVISGNRFVDNWAGIMAWENSDRFSGSPANSSSDYTTLVNPRQATVDACGTPALIATRPYVDDCRWKVQHLRVHHNKFVLRPESIGGSCTPRAGCGYTGLFSNYGTYPTWSPFQGYFVPDNISSTQDNVWSDNKYVGPWRFMAHTLWNTVSWKTWRGTRFDQDAGSTLQ